jgi:hypothetical protein
MEQAWAFEHSLECPVTREFAWGFWTNVSNWAFDSDIQSVQLEGAFVAGSHGVTTSRRAGRIEWQLSSVHAGEGAVVEIPVPGAVARFSWTFENLGDTTRITQRVTIEGEKARSYAPVLEKGIPGGMRELAENMAKAAAGSR